VLLAGTEDITKNSKYRLLETVKKDQSCPDIKQRKLNSIANSRANLSRLRKLHQSVYLCVYSFSLFRTGLGSCVRPEEARLALLQEGHTHM
jgi:hypothetical protein